MVMQESTAQQKAALRLSGDGPQTPTCGRILGDDSFPAGKRSWGVIVLLLIGAAALTALVPPCHFAFGALSKACGMPNWLTAFLPGNIAAPG